MSSRVDFNDAELLDIIVSDDKKFRNCSVLVAMCFDAIFSQFGVAVLRKNTSSERCNSHFALSLYTLSLLPSSL